MTRAAGTTISLLAIDRHQVSRVWCGHGGFVSPVNLHERRGGVTEIHVEMTIVPGIEDGAGRGGAEHAGRGGS